MVTLKDTETEIYVITIPTVISESNDTLEETLDHFNSLKIRIYPMEVVVHFYAAILVDSDHLDSDISFQSYELGYFTCIFEDTSNSRVFLWGIYNYNRLQIL